MSSLLSQTTRIVVLLCCALFGATNPAEAFSAMEPSRASSSSVAAQQQHQQQHQHQHHQHQQHEPPLPLSRRDWMSTVGGTAAFVASVAVTTTAAVGGFPPNAMAEASATTTEYLSELQTSLTKLRPLPKLLEEQKWDEARSILKNPPVNKLWNLGDSQNTVLKLVKETGNVELFEIKDDLAYNLQSCDQLAYANNFIEFQPGNGKLKIKEPIEAVSKAIKQLETIINESI